ncbi:MAG: DUF3461 family protein [Oceanospirillaceae bacterium]|nr:DUF3461 family protein [Oceanospirillaceae bacterium]
MAVEKFPALVEMGFEDPGEIERYTTRIEGDVDILKIYHRRQQGEWMTKSKKYKFKRLHKKLRVNEGLTAYRDTTESSPFFLKAISELDKLVAGERTAKAKKEDILEEMEHLNKVVSRKIEDLRRQIEEL